MSENRTATKNSWLHRHTKSYNAQELDDDFYASIADASVVVVEFFLHLMSLSHLYRWK